MSQEKVEVVKVYNGKKQKWAIGRFSDRHGKPGQYFVGIFVEHGINFATDKGFSSREDGEGWLVYHIDSSVAL